MITQFELCGRKDTWLDCHCFLAQFQRHNSNKFYRPFCVVSHKSFVTHHDRWSNWGWDELMKFIAFNFVDPYDSQDTYARCSLVDERS